MASPVWSINDVEIIYEIYLLGRNQQEMSEASQIARGLQFEGQL